MALELCAHGMNPKSCPMCWQLQAAAPKAPKPKDAPLVVTTANVMPIGDALLRSTQGAEARARIAQQFAKQKDEAGKQSAVRIEDEQESFADNGLWQPKERKSLIDSLPKHPHAQEGRATRMR